MVDIVETLQDKCASSLNFFSSGHTLSEVEQQDSRLVFHRMEHEIDSLDCNVETRMKARLTLILWKEGEEY